jgi:hypothetical protein
MRRLPHELKREDDGSSFASKENNRFSAEHRRS